MLRQDIVNCFGYNLLVMLDRMENTISPFVLYMSQLFLQLVVDLSGNTNCFRSKRNAFLSIKIFKMFSTR